MMKKKFFAHWARLKRVVVLCLFLPMACLCSLSYASDTPPNVVLVSVDTLRADRLGCYGYELDTSPHIDAFAAQGLLFEDCVCEVPLTAPSMGSMLTSRYPRMNGTTRNGLRLPDDTPLITEQFKAVGYYTFCVQSNWTLKAKLSGLQRGFDVYRDDFHKKRWGFIKPEREGDAVTDISLELLQTRPKDKPFFAWIHYSDPHAPYKMHAKYNPSGKRAFHFRKKKRIPARYDSEVAFTDAEIGRLLSALPTNTAVLFVADHGESLFEHDYLGHGRRIYQDNMHVPLIIRAPGLQPGRTAAPVRGVDVGPTLLGLAGLSKTETMIGIDVLKRQPGLDRIRVVETYGGAVPNIPGVKAVMKDAAPMRQGVIDTHWKLILNGRKVELFRLDQDPGELVNLKRKNPEKVEALRLHIKHWDEGTLVAEEGEEHLDEDDLKALESLGYLE